MSEGDRFERAFGAGWRAAYKWAREGVATPAEIADKCVSTLAKTLRERNGVPGFREMEDVVGNAAWRLALQTNGVGEEAAILIDAFDTLDRIVRDQEGYRHTKIAAESAKSMLIQQGDQGFRPMKSEFAEKTCVDIVEHYYFGTARQNLVAEGKLENHEKARQWQHSVEEAMRPGIRQMAERLMKDPSAKTLRAPNRTDKPHSTSDLLEEVLVTSETLNRG